MSEVTPEFVEEKLKQTNLKNAIGLSEDDGEAFNKIESIFKDLPAGDVGFVNLATGNVVNMGKMDDQIAAVLYEEGQSDSGGGGASHIIKYDSLFNLINSEPPINYGLTLHSELPVAYGYRFQKPEPVPELEGMKTVPEISMAYWSEWSKYIILDHILKMTFHSLKAMGVVYIEKTYDTSGLNKYGWGIRKLRVLSPDAMYVVVDSKGNIIAFIQWAGETSRKFVEDVRNGNKINNGRQKRINERKILNNDLKPFLREHPGAIVIPRHKIVYATYNAYYDDTVYGYGSLVPNIPYSKSKIGIQKRVLRMIENSASSFVVFKYGTESFPVAGKGATKVMSAIAAKKNPKYVVLPFYFDVQTVELGKSMQNVEPFLNFFNDQQMAGLGVPLVLLKPGSSGEGASIQLEATTRLMKYSQNVVSNILRKQVFAEVLLGDPTKSQKLFTDDPINYPYMRPSVYHKLPVLAWNVIESVADRRLRLDVDAKHGAIGLTEYRQEIGRLNKIAKGDEMPLIKLQMESADNQMKLAKMQADTTLAVAEKNATNRNTSSNTNSNTTKKKASK